MLHRIFVLALSVAVVLFASSPSPAAADDINWVGYQFGPPGGLGINPFDEASFFHSDNWEGYQVPSGQDTAVFDEGFDPQGNGMPHTLYFGDYTRPSYPLFAPEPQFIAGGPATLAGIWIERGSFDFLFTNQSSGQTQGSLTVENISIGSLAGSSSPAALTLRGGPTTSQTVYVDGADASVLNVEGQSTSLTITENIDFRIAGGSLNVIDGASLTKNSGSTSVISRNGAGSVVNIAGGSHVLSTSGVLNIGEAGDSVTSNKVTIRDHQSSWNITHPTLQPGFYVVDARIGNGSLEVLSGGSMSNLWTFVGDYTVTGASAGTVKVDGQSAFGRRSSITSNLITVGGYGAGDFTVSNGGQVAGNLEIGGTSSDSSSDGNGTVSINGASSSWDASIIGSTLGDVSVGRYGTGTLTISNGGKLFKTFSGSIGSDANSVGSANVSGTGSRWEAKSLFVGGSPIAAGGTGELVVDDSGLVAVASELRVWQDGTVDIGPTGIVSVGTVGANPTPGSLIVGTGGTLSGSGAIVGNTIVTGGTLAPGASPGTLTFDGDLSLGVDSLIRIELGGTNAGFFDQLHVTGDLSILGTINVSLVDGFRPQSGDLFQLFDIGGTLDTANARFQMPGGIEFESTGPGIFRVVEIPEPSSIIQMMLLSCLFGVRRRWSAVARTVI